MGEPPEKLGMTSTIEPYGSEEVFKPTDWQVRYTSNGTSPGVEPLHKDRSAPL